MLTNGEADFLEWLTGLAIAGLAWAIRGTWKASSTITTMKTDIENLERTVEAYDLECKRLQRAMSEDLSKTLGSSFKLMLKDMAIDHTKELAEISKSLAEVSQHSRLIGDQVAKLSDKVDNLSICKTK